MSFSFSSARRFCFRSLTAFRVYHSTANKHLQCIRCRFIKVRETHEPICDSDRHTERTSREWESSIWIETIGWRGDVSAFRMGEKNARAETEIEKQSTELARFYFRYWIFFCFCLSKCLCTQHCFFFLFRSLSLSASCIFVFAFGA